MTGLFMSHPTITGLMKRLEAKGFITRKNSPADFRCKYVKLTKKGCDIERGLKTLHQTGNRGVRQQQRGLNALLGYLMFTVFE